MMTRFQVFDCPRGNAGPTAMMVNEEQRKTWKCNGPDTGPCTDMQSSFKSEVDLMLWDDGLESVRISTTTGFLAANSQDASFGRGFANVPAGIAWGWSCWSC